MIPLVTPTPIRNMASRISSAISHHRWLMRSRGNGMPTNVPRNLKIVRMSEHRTPPFGRPQETFTSMDFGFAFSDLGRRTFKTPSLYSALTLLPSASSGKVKLRIKLP